ncbi:MAG: hypothetical protein MK132_04090 [Lentisphaerales bacterium]|nr:hypothetical protein [Lentisphaerales bacterium]
MEKRDKTMVSLHDHLKEVKKFAKDSDNKKVIEIASKAEASSRQYQATFKKVYDDLEKRGLDHKPGLYGEFCAIVHTVETVFKSYQVDRSY